MDFYEEELQFRGSQKSLERAALEKLSFAFRWL
jgi:hypothetical protein